MAMSRPILTETFAADTQVGGNLVVVHSATNAGNVSLPAAARAAKITGVTLMQADNQNTVSVVTWGVHPVQSDGSAAIAPGDKVEIGNTSGQIRTVVPSAPATPGTQGNWVIRGLVGTARSAAANGATGALVDVEIRPQDFLGA